MTLADSVAHLSPERWERANRLLIRKRSRSSPTSG